MQKIVFMILALLPCLLIGDVFVQYRYFSQASSTYDEILSLQKYSPDIGRLYDNHADAFMFQIRTLFPTAFLLVMVALLCVVRRYKMPIFYVLLAFPVLLWVLTATLGVSQVKNRILGEYTGSLSKEWVDKHPLSELKNLAKYPDAEVPNYQLCSWSPSPFVIITNCDFTHGVTAGISFQAVHFWWGDWERILMRVTGIS